jgi:hypothetical protein
MVLYEKLKVISKQVYQLVDEHLPKFQGEVILEWHNSVFNSTGSKETTMKPAAILFKDSIQKSWLKTQSYRVCRD